MPAAEPATVERAGETLRFAGALQRNEVAALWRHALPQIGGIERFDLAAVARVDSAGVALLAELATRSGTTVVIDGTPPGLVELRAAYRLAPTLAFA